MGATGLRVRREYSLVSIGLAVLATLTVGFAYQEDQVTLSSALVSWIVLSLAFILPSLALTWVGERLENSVSTSGAKAAVKGGSIVAVIAWLGLTLQLCGQVGLVKAHTCIYVGLLGGLLAAPIIGVVMTYRRAQRPSLKPRVEGDDGAAAVSIPI